MVANTTMGDNDEAPLDEKVVKRTQETLGKLIKAPPLTEKLLARPPFRFLHDVISAVMKATGFMKGLFSESDLKSDNVKEKEQKVAFLQKAIEFVVFVNGRQISTNPLKVVAGKEPDKTNEFLQALAEAASKKIENDVMVKRFLGGERLDSNAPQGKPSQNKQAAPPAKPTATQPQSKPKTKESEKPSGSKQSGQSRGEKEDKGKSLSPSRGREKSPERPADTTNLKNRPREAGRERGNTRNPGDPDEDSEGEQQAADPGLSGDQQSNRRLNRPPSARGRQPSGVPSSRGSRGPETSGSNAPSENVTSAKPSKLATPSASDSKSKVVIQKAAKADSDEEDEFVVREAGPGALPMGAPDGTAATLLGANEDQHGALVQKIIDTTKALDAKTGAKTTKLSPADEAALRRQREAVTKEMERLCVAVQASARLAAPLARLSELVQEDLDAMNTELSTWRAEHRKAVAAIAQAANPAAANKSGGSSSSHKSAVTAASAANEALRGQLRELDSQLAEMADSVAAVRGNCMRNEQRIAHMLSGSGGVSSTTSTR